MRTALAALALVVAADGPDSGKFAATLKRSTDGRIL
jgi:hypothetical protein